MDREDKQQFERDFAAHREFVLKRAAAGGRAKTPAKAAAARRNGKKGGQRLSDRKCSICNRKRLGTANRSGVCRRCIPALRKALRAQGRRGGRILPEESVPGERETIRQAMSILGSRRSPAKTEASKRNGKLGGRPKLTANTNPS